MGPALTASSAATRAQLLTDRAERVHALRRRLASLRRRLVPGVLLLVLTLTGFGVSGLADGGDAVTGLVVVTALAALTGAALLRHAHASRRLRDELATWEDADRTAAARALPAGDLGAGDTDLRTPWDARDDADLADVVRRAELSAGRSIRDLRLTLTTMTSAVPGLLGLVLCLSGLLDDDAPGAARVAAVVAGLPGVLCLLLDYAFFLREGARRQALADRGRIERQVLVARLAERAGTAVPALPEASAWARPLAFGALLVVAVLVVGAIADSVIVAVVTVLGVLVLVGAPIARSAVRQRRTHVVPLGAGGDDLLHGAGSGVVRVEDLPDRLRLVPAEPGAAVLELSHDRVRGVADVQPGKAWAPRGVVLLTDDEPVVLAGHGVPELPAIVRLRQGRRGHHDGSSAS